MGLRATGVQFMQRGTLGMCFTPVRLFATGHSDALPLSPSVHRLVAIHNLNPTIIPSTGRKGRLLKGDVLAYLAGHPSSSSSAPASAVPASSSTSPSPPAPSPPAAKPPTVVVGAAPVFTDVPLTNIRKIIATRLAEAKRQIPHAYAEKQISMDAVLAMRKEKNKVLAERGEKPTSINDWIIKAAATALLEVPAINVTRNPTTGEVIQNPSPSISVAVAIPDGLITPIIQNTATKGVAAIGEEVRALAEKARTGKLLPHEFQGGTFTISNLGMFGISSFTAVINPPQTAILAVGGSVSRVLVDEETHRLKQAQSVSFSLSYDSRAIDPEAAAAFLQRLDGILTKPYSLL